MLRSNNLFQYNTAPERTWSALSHQKDYEKESPLSSLDTSACLGRQSLDFWKFWAGETISNLGSSFTEFALLLLVFKLTGSALNLGIATAASFLPYLFFGLVIGALVDRLNRKRVMLLVDLGQMLIIAAIPVAFLMGALSIWWVYGVAFISGILKTAFEMSQFAAIPSLVNQNDLLRANGRLQASFFGATILGPLRAGALLFMMPVPLLLFIDAGSLLISACMLSLIITSFNSTGQREQQSIRQDVFLTTLSAFSASPPRNNALAASGPREAQQARVSLLHAAPARRRRCGTIRRANRKGPPRSCLPLLHLRCQTKPVISPQAQSGLLN